MIHLEPPDTHHLSAAEGWLMLGDGREARRELRKIRVNRRRHRAVLQVRWRLCAASRKWKSCLVLARFILQLAPESPFGWIHRSFALHEMKQTQEAWDQLLPAVERFPREFIIPYNLACYACQLGRYEEAWGWLERAQRAGDVAVVKAMALDDPDLKPFWEQLRASTEPPEG